MSLQAALQLTKALQVDMLHMRRLLVGWSGILLKEHEQILQQFLVVLLGTLQPLTRVYNLLPHMKSFVCKLCMLTAARLQVTVSQLQCLQSTAVFHCFDDQDLPCPAL